MITWKNVGFQKFRSVKKKKKKLRLLFFYIDIDYTIVYKKSFIKTETWKILPTSLSFYTKE